MSEALKRLGFLSKKIEWMNALCVIYEKAYMIFVHYVTVQ